MSDTTGDERIKEMSGFRKALIRPELGSICGAILVFVFFLLVARDSGMFAVDGVMNWGVVSAQFAIIAVGACLLMISGEFDLSVGSMIGFSGIIIALLSVTWGLPMWFAILMAFAVAMSIGWVPGSRFARDTRSLSGFVLLRRPSVRMSSGSGGAEAEE